MPPEFTTMQEIETHFIAILKKKARQQGLIYTKLNEACGDSWAKALAELKNLRTSKPRKMDLKDLVHGLWERSLLVVEPPVGMQREPRIWGLDAATERFPHLLKSDSRRPESDSTILPADLELIKAVYDGLVRDHAGGYVPIYKVRRSLNWPRDKFDRALRELNERRKPVIELHGGDPQSYSEDQRTDSLMRELNLYLRMRWR
jgi:hypothetical protein